MLHALDEAGVKVDLVAGCGIGAASAMYAAVDGGTRLWDPGGVWRRPGVARLYRWRGTVRLVHWTVIAILATLCLPLGFLIASALVYPAVFFLRLLGLEAGAGLAARYGRVLEATFASPGLPTSVPRIVAVLAGALLAWLAALGVVTLVRGWWSRRRVRGGVWWRLLGPPLTAADVREWFADGLWQLMRGAVPLPRPSRADLSQRYSELLAENVGQPGVRELVIVTHDLDARRDLVFALVAEPYRRRFFHRAPTASVAEWELETLDLGGAASAHAIDALWGALSLPVATEPHLLTFAPDSPWRGETHRLCHWPGLVGRLLDEVAQAGVEQVILVAATTDVAGPHALVAARGDARGGAGEYFGAQEAAAIRDAWRARAGLFQGVFEIRPPHNPLGPFDFGGCYDERSDRRQTLAELIDRGYEDAYRLFVDPVVGASGDRLEGARPAGVPRELE